MNKLLNVLIRVIVIGVSCWLLWWLVGYVGMGQPFDKVARVFVAVVGVVLVIREMIGLAGGAGPSPGA